MQLSYRGRQYTPETAEVPTTEQTFKGQFLGITTTLSTTYRAGMPSATIPLTYRGQRYLGDR